MAKQLETTFARDRLRLAISIIIIGLGVWILVLVPSLGMPTLLGGVLAVIGSPAVTFLERRGLSRSLAVTLASATGALVGVGLVTWGLSHVVSQWEAFSQSFPVLFEQAVARLRETEDAWRKQVSALSGIHLTDTLLSWFAGSRAWFAENAPRVMGNVLSWSVLSPFVAFVLLKDGPTLRRAFYALVPNRYFEEVFIVSSKILESLGLYVRAKLVEAIVAGLICGIGLALVGAPYAWVLGLIAGVTNIVPYVGPLLGAAPALLIPLFDPSQASLLWPMFLVFATANIIDTVVVFPIFVAQVVDLHPLVLIGAVIVGQNYYGLVGMLLSVPLAACLKVVGLEMYAVLMNRRVRGSGSAIEP